MIRIIWIMAIVSVIIAVVLSLNWFFVPHDSNFFIPINIFSAIGLVLPIALIKYYEYNIVKKIEKMFPVFLRDFMEAMHAGMTMPQAFKSVSKNDYKILTPYIKKVSAQLEWGIPIDQVLFNFSKQTKSKVISRIVSSVIESHRYGGRLADTFEALTKAVVQVDRMRSERSLYLQSQLITGYIIFFVFILVILVLEIFLVPFLTENVPLTILQDKEAIESLPTAAQYTFMFRNLILIQGLFAGLAIGKMAEGALIAGLKHSLIMTIGGILIFTLFS